MVWPEIILAIELWLKSKMATITARLSYKLPSFSTEWTAKHNFDVYHWVFMYSRHNVLLESTLDIALWVKYTMAAEWKKIRDFSNTLVGFSYTPL